MNTLNSIQAANAAFDLLTDLSTDPYLQVDFEHDPRAVMSRAGLSVVDQARFLAGAIEPSLAGWQSCTTCGDPGPDPFEEPDPPLPSAHPS